MANKIEKIIVHCSDSGWGDANIIRTWHLERGWRDIGYHFVILNGFLRPKFFLKALDGSIEPGRLWDGSKELSSAEFGAHALGYNKNSIGICLIGKSYFSDKQRLSLTKLVSELVLEYNLQASDVLGHYEIESANGKTCPNLDMRIFRLKIESYQNLHRTEI
jgi:hypothetical protein